MHIKKESGNALAQYGIILGLIAIALIPIFFIFGKTITDNFTSFQSYLSESEISNSNITGNNNNNSPSSSSITCENGTCEITLSNGVTLNTPENFNDFIETSGSSGGVGEFAKIIDQLIAQMKPGDDSLCNSASESACTKDLKPFSDLIKLQADNYKFIEDIAKQGDKASFQAASNKSFNNLGYTPPAELANVLPNADYDYYISSILNERNHIGYSGKLNDPGAEPNSDNCLGSALIDQYDVIMESNAYNKNVKDIVSEIISGMSQMSTNMEALAQAAKNSENTGTAKSFNPFTGEQLETKTVHITDLTGLTNPSEEIEFDLLKLFK